MDLTLNFRNPEQEKFFFSKARNNRFGGGFGNGKTYVAMQRAAVMLLSFPNYRVAICRQVYKNLRATTMQTFFKIIDRDALCKIHDETFGVTVLFNGSRVYWLHLDSMDEATAKGFEINSLIIDQAEEVSEAIYNLMDARVGRWDKAQVPDYLLAQYPNWPRHPKWGHHLVPNYVDILDNPADDEFHWVNRFYDENSDEKKANHFSIVRKTDDDLNDPGTIAQILDRDEEWVKKYYYGEQGTSKARIHKIPPACILNPDEIEESLFAQLLFAIRTRASLYRILDHGETAPTACGWAGKLFGVHIFFGEYYVPGKTIGVHRINIHDITLTLCGESNIRGTIDLADPAIFKLSTQKHGAFWSVAKEYEDEEEIDAPPISWAPADNNELATRNRINELMKPSVKFRHPLYALQEKDNPVSHIDGNNAAPGIYFIKATSKYPHGCHNIIIETNKQKKQYIDTLNGKSIYSDERDDSIVDHAYDLLRYYVAAHNPNKTSENRVPPRRSFAHLNAIMQAKKQMISAGSAD